MAFKVWFSEALSCGPSLLFFIFLLTQSVGQSSCFDYVDLSSVIVSPVGFLGRSTTKDCRTKSKCAGARVQERNMITSASADDNPSSVVSGKKTLSANAPSLSSSSSCQTASSPCIDYTTNPTVFGQILLGNSKAIILDESNDLLAFHDIRPRAPLHGLVIPKRYIPTILDLDVDSDNDKNNHPFNLLQQMHDMAHQILQQNLTPQQYQQHDYILCFHIPPFNSVNHLHLHVLAPASKMSWIWKYVKYNTRTRWCISFEEVTSRIQEGQTVVPYTRTDSWSTILYQIVCPAHGRKY
jgi:diadenosine tetraphosphate (Ap4A) HIT family hydrolase